MRTSAAPFGAPAAPTRSTGIIKVFRITACGLVLGHYLRHHVETLRESCGLLHGALRGPSD